MAKQSRIASPSVPVNNRAFLECTADEFMVAAGIQAVVWVKDADYAAGIEGLTRILPKMPQRSIERAVASLKKRGLAGAVRKFGGASKFEVYFDDLSFQELREILQDRQLGVLDTATLAQMNRQVGGVISSTDSIEDSEIETRTKAEKKAKGAAIGAILSSFKKIWELEFKEPYKSNAQDGKAADRLVKLNVTPETVEAKALQFVKSADPWIRARGHAFWVLEWKWVEFRAVKPQGNKPEFEG